MKAIVVPAFGGADVLSYVDIPEPHPQPNEVLIKVSAAGVGPWDALVREGKSALGQRLPFIPGADLSGTVEAVGSNVTDFRCGDAIYGVTNAQFTGAYAQLAICESAKIALKPRRLTFLQAASAPVVAVTAWQMVFEYANVQPGKTVLVHGAGGNVGAYAVQFAKFAGATVFGTGSSSDRDYVDSIGLDRFIDFRVEHFEEVAREVDAVLDTVGGDTLARSFSVTREGGTVVSIVSEPQPHPFPQSGRHAIFFIADVTRERLQKLTPLFDDGSIETRVGEVIPLQDARRAHEMLAGQRHQPGRIVLSVE